MSKVSKQFPAIDDQLYKQWWLQLINFLKTCEFMWIHEKNDSVHFYLQVLLQQRINTNKHQQPVLKSSNHIHCLQCPTCLPLFVLVLFLGSSLSLSSHLLSFVLPPPTMRMNSMVNRTGWYEHAIIDWLGRFQVPREEQWPQTSNSKDCCWHSCQKFPNRFQPSMTSYISNGDCNSSYV